jgi:hypothetical protein
MDKVETGEFESVFLRFDRKTAKSMSLEFVPSLPAHVIELSIDGPLADDTQAFRNPHLRHLELLTRSKRPLDLARLRQLESLTIDFRPNMEEIRTLSQLVRLRVTLFTGADLGFLGDNLALEGLRIEAKHQPISLDGLQRCRALRRLEVYDSSVRSLAPLRGLSMLNRIQLYPTSRIDQSEPWDLSALTSMSDLEWLKVGAVRSLAPLRQLTTLRGVTVTSVEDGDLAPLLALPQLVSFGFDDETHHSHTFDEIYALRQA